MKIVLTCHTEYDLKNKTGRTSHLPVGDQTFLHLPLLRDLVRASGLPFTWALMVGGASGDRLIRAVAAEGAEWKNSGELAIHFHSERFIAGRWTFEGFLQPEEYAVFWKSYTEILGHEPKSVVFGKWKIDEPVFRKLREWGIDHEGTALFPDKMITPPFEQDGMVKVPLLIAFDRRPLNPFTQISHWLYLNRIIKTLHGADVLVHLALHSYDLFDFESGRPRFKRQKLMVWKNLVGLIEKYGLEVLPLSEVEPFVGEERDYLEDGVLARFFNRLRH